jgi:BirA family biotin operon repressor/biotin-[acetyl-CoA-carboxylase] ligase
MSDTRRDVLDALADGPISGPEIAEDLDISRTAVWKQVEALRESGFEVVSGPNGYQLVSSPEFGGLSVEHGLAAPYEVRYEDSMGSTNDRARSLAAEETGDVVVLTGEQTSGRGRLDREWTGPEGGIYASVLLRPSVPPARVPLFTFAAAVAVATAARDVGVDASIKWPNDVLVDGQKIAGILTEMEGEADRVNWIVVGIGINANVRRRQLPSEATSLQALTGEEMNRREITQQVLETFHEGTTDLGGVLDDWRELTTTLDQRVRLTTPEETIIGTATDIEEPGTLVVDTDEGTRRVHAGDCEHLRPAGGG